MAITAANFRTSLVVLAVNVFLEIWGQLFKVSLA